MILFISSSLFQHTSSLVCLYVRSCPLHLLTSCFSHSRINNSTFFSFFIVFLVTLCLPIICRVNLYILLELCVLSSVFYLRYLVFSFLIYPSFGNNMYLMSFTIVFSPLQRHSQIPYSSQISNNQHKFYFTSPFGLWYIDIYILCTFFWLRTIIVFPVFPFEIVT